MLTSARTSCYPCKCSLDYTVADCSDLHLSNIPKLPETIEILDLSNNLLRDISSKTFLHVIGIKKLKLSNNFIQGIAKDTFSKTLNRDLVDLDMSNNPLESPTEVFRALAVTKLEYLDLSNTTMHFSALSTLDPLSMVPIRVLNLQNNVFKIIKGNLTKCLPKLETLIISANLIKKISFSDVHENIIELDLDMNIFSTIPSFCLNTTRPALPGLKKLSLSANLITSLKGLYKLKQCLQNLETLLMDNSHIFEIQNNTFAGLPNLRCLSLDRINSQRLTISSTAFNSTSLRSLTLGTVQREIKFEADIFHLCPNLTSLRLAEISFQKWTDKNLRKLFAPLLELTDLSLVKAQMMNIPIGFLPRIQKLTYLELSNNFLSSWQSKVFENATSLQTLILKSNMITHINESFFPEFLWKQIEVLDIAYNPFDCSCELYWFRKWLNTNSHKMKNYPKMYFCKSPSKYKERRLISYDPSYRECHPLPTLTIVLIVIACVVVTLVTVVAIVYKHRWHIKYCIYLIRSRREYQPIPGDDPYIYDAFVAYNTSDRVWVISALMEFLEKKHGMRLCLHERDFSAGMLIVDNIIDKFNVSRKVILVLTNEFAKSQWCKFETLMAQDRFFKNGASSLVLLMLEDISSSNMNGPLSLLLQSTTYVEWTKEPAGNDVFWKQLLQSMK